MACVVAGRSFLLMCFSVSQSGAFGLFADNDAHVAICEVVFWCSEFLVTVLSSQLHSAVKKRLTVTERCDLIMVYTTSNSTVSPFYPSQSYISSLFVLLRELPRSWWEASGDCSGWTLIACFLLLLVFLQLDFSRGGSTDREGGRDATVGAVELHPC